MMVARRTRLARASAGVAFAASLASVAAWAQQLPQGVATQTVPRGLALADAGGRTLYRYDGTLPGGRSTCEGACAKEWPPLLAPADAVAFGPWSIVPRRDGARQWALNGKPLHTYARDAGLGDAAGDAGGIWNVVLSAEAAEVLMAAPVSSKPEPIPWLPPGIALRASGDGSLLVNREGDTLHAFPPGVVCSGPCLGHWRPVAAPMAAHAVGDWSAWHGAAGQAQWAYRNQPLFTSVGGPDAAHRADESKAQPVLLAKH